LPVTVVVGGFFGDEGKGKLISHLVQKDVEIVARGGVGPNAGHTVVVGNKTYKLRMVPSGFAGENVEKLLIGPGVLINPDVMIKEMKVTESESKLFCDYNCGIISEEHIKKDNSDVHLTSTVGTSGSGTGPANEDRVKRKLALAKDLPELANYLIDVPLELHKAIKDDRSILLEGTQATHLSLWHGTYPHVTSKDITASAICSDVGIGPTCVDDVIVGFKAFVTRVGSIKADKMQNELSEKETKRRGWEEYGTVTQRIRRAAPFNLELARRSIMLNGATKIAITKLDILFPDDEHQNSFSNLSIEAKNWISQKENQLGMKFSWIGTGPADSDIIDRTNA
jgi:adenylosuccinate synthase